MSIRISWPVLIVLFIAVTSCMAYFTGQWRAARAEEQQQLVLLLCMDDPLDRRDAAGAQILNNCAAPPLPMKGSRQCQEAAGILTWAIRGAMQRHWLASGVQIQCVGKATVETAPDAPGKVGRQNYFQSDT